MSSKNAQQIPPRAKAYFKSHLHSRIAPIVKQLGTELQGVDQKTKNELGVFIRLKNQGKLQIPDGGNGKNDTIQQALGKVVERCDVMRQRSAKALKTKFTEIVEQAIIDLINDAFKHAVSSLSGETQKDLDKWDIAVTTVNTVLIIGIIALGVFLIATNPVGAGIAAAATGTAIVLNVLAAMDGLTKLCKLYKASYNNYIKKLDKMQLELGEANENIAKALKTLDSLEQADVALAQDEKKIADKLSASKKKLPQKTGKAEEKLRKQIEEIETELTKIKDLRSKDSRVEYRRQLEAVKTVLQKQPTSDIPKESTFIGRGIELGFNAVVTASRSLAIAAK